LASLRTRQCPVHWRLIESVDTARLHAARFHAGRLRAAPFLACAE
jgi:hypothetical protein